MDAFAHTRNQAGSVTWTSINWDTWAFEANAGTDPTRLELNAEQGVEAFRRILGAAVAPQIVVSTGNLHDRIEQWVNPKAVQKGRTVKEKHRVHLHSRPELAHHPLAQLARSRPPDPRRGLDRRRRDRRTRAGHRRLAMASTKWSSGTRVLLQGATDFSPGG